MVHKNYLSLYSVLLLCFLSFLYIIATTGVISNSSLPNYFPLSTSENEITISTKLSIINRTKIIVLGDSMWGYRFGVGKQSFLDAGCPVSNCFITRDQNYVKNQSFDAFVIHVPTMYKLLPLPNRRPEQVVVFFSTEPPQHMPNLAQYDNYFNWTMTYRSDSDIHLPYGRIEALPWAPKTQSEVTSKMALVAGRTNPAAGKTRLAVWFVSNCNAPSNRRKYVEILQKYIDVDIFSQDGRCGGKDLCPRKKNSEECYDSIEKTYKFYLSFENAICKEYVTEKFYDMMGRTIVPVVLGGVNYSELAPQHSFINALDYKPRELADYLKKLDADDSLYAEYFWWKPFYRVKNLIETNRVAFCHLCAALHSSQGVSRTANGLQKWYHEQSECKHRPKFEDD